MSEFFITEPVMRAFQLELSKEAAPPVQAILSHLGRPGVRHSIGAGAGSGLGLGLGLGAALGAVAGGRKAYGEAREQGASRLEALRAGAGGGVGGAVRGLGKGAILGAAGGAALGAVAPTQVISATRALAKSDRLGSLSRFGQRQVHSLSGWKPGGSTSSVERIGAGAAGARRALEQTVAAGGDAAAVAKGRAALSAAETAQKMGLTSLPGLASSVKEHGVLPTLAAGAREQWTSNSGVGKALMVGLPALSVAGAVNAPEQEGGPGKAERIGRTLGGTLGYAAAPLSLGASTVLGTGLERVGGLAGKGIDKLRRRHRPEVPQEPLRPPATEPGDTGQVATERVYGTGYSGGVGGLE